jgi:hypothetical protein
MVRSNVSSMTSFGDLADLFDDVSFGSNNNTLSTRVLQITDPESVINNEHNDDSVDSVIRKVDSCTIFVVTKPT